MHRLRRQPVRAQGKYTFDFGKDWQRRSVLIMHDCLSKNPEQTSRRALSTGSCSRLGSWFVQKTTGTRRMWTQCALASAQQTATPWSGVETALPFAAPPASCKARKSLCSGSSLPCAWALCSEMPCHSMMPFPPLPNNLVLARRRSPLTNREHSTVELSAAIPSAPPESPQIAVLSGSLCAWCLIMICHSMMPFLSLAHPPGDGQGGKLGGSKPCAPRRSTAFHRSTGLVFWSTICVICFYI